MQEQLTEAVSATTMTYQEITRLAWLPDPTFNNFVYVIWGIMYLLTITPSALGLTPILTVKAFIFWFLIYDGVLKFLSLEKNVLYAPSIWTIQNWFLYSLRRVGVEFLISSLYPVTQTVVTWNWALNLIPLALSYVNMFLV